MGELATRPSFWYLLPGTVLAVGMGLNFVFAVAIQQQFLIVLTSGICWVALIVAAAISWAIYFKKYIDFRVKTLEQQLASTDERIRHDLTKHEESFV
jgi:signal transduction histidine kinase